MSLYDNELMEGLLEAMEAAEEERSFRIDDDHKAEWAMRVIAEERAEAERLNDIRRKMIADYTEQIRRENERLEKRTSMLTAMLMDYFDTVEHRSTATQEKYRLPSGELVRKYPAPKIERNDAQLVEWLKANGCEQYVKVKETPAWDELKKQCVSFDGDGYAIYMPTGEVIDGVAAVPQEAVFNVEIRG